MKHKFALLLAILGFGTLVCVLLFSRDNKLQYQTRPQTPAAVETSLAPNLEPLAEAPAPVSTPAEAAKPEAAPPPVPKPAAAKAKS